MIKIRVRGQSIQFCTKIRMRHNKDKILKDQIDDLETEGIIINNASDKKKLLEAKQKLVEKMDEIHKIRQKQHRSVPEPTMWNMVRNQTSTSCP